MIISHSHKFIFCRNMRSGSTSIKKRLALLAKDTISLDINHKYYGAHMPMKEIRSHVTAEEYDTYFKFAFVRNPWDRMASNYIYGLLGEATKGSYNVAPLEPYNKWLDAILPDFPNYVKRLNSDSYLKYTPKTNQFFRKLTRPFRKPLDSGIGIHFGDNFALPQYDFVKGVDFIGKYESLQEGFAHVASVTKIPYERLKHLNKSFKPNYRSMYDEESRRIVEKHYAKDIKAFGYEF